MKCGDFSENTECLTFTVSSRESVIAFNLLIFLFRLFSIVFVKVKTALSVCKITVANNVVKYEQNGLQSVLGEPPVS